MIETRGQPKYPEYPGLFTKSYQLLHSMDGEKWVEGPVLEGNKDISTIKRHTFTGFKARFVRLVVKSWDTHPYIQMEVYIDK